MKKCILILTLLGFQFFNAAHAESDVSAVNTFVNIVKSTDSVTPELAGEALGVTFALKEKQTNPYYGFFEAFGSGDVATYQLRIPKKNATGKALLSAYPVHSKITKKMLTPLLENTKQLDLHIVPHTHPLKVGETFEFENGRTLSITREDAEPQIVISLSAEF